MNFIDTEHKEFYENTISQIEKTTEMDVYYHSLIYTLGICPITRKHFNEIFNIKKCEVNPDSLHKEWQTSTSLKTTRIALNLWNQNLMYDNQEDFDNKKVSSFYMPSEIFSCSYAPFFYEAIKIRYPEYTMTKEKQESEIIDNEEEIEDM